MKLDSPLKPLSQNNMNDTDDTFISRLKIVMVLVLLPGSHEKGTVESSK